MCQYLYASFSLKTDPDEGLTAGQAEAVGRWRKSLTGIAIEEMLHLALVAKVLTAIGAAPSLTRPNFPRRSEYLPPGVRFALRVDDPFSVLGAARGDAAAGRGGIRPCRAAARTGRIRRGDAALAGFLDCRAPLPRDHARAEPPVRPPRRAGPVRGADACPGQAGLFRWPRLIAVTGPESGHAAIGEIIELARVPAVTSSRRITAGSCASGRNTGNCGNRTVVRPRAAGHPRVHPAAVRHPRAAAAADRVGHPRRRRAVQPRVRDAAAAADRVFTHTDETGERSARSRRARSG